MKEGKFIVHCRSRTVLRWNNGTIARAYSTGWEPEANLSYLNDARSLYEISTYARDDGERRALQKLARKYARRAMAMHIRMQEPGVSKRQYSSARYHCVRSQVNAAKYAALAMERWDD